MIGHDTAPSRATGGDTASIWDTLNGAYQALAYLDGVDGASGTLDIVRDLLRDDAHPDTPQDSRHLTTLTTILGHAAANIRLMAPNIPRATGTLTTVADALDNIVATRHAAASSRPHTGQSTQDGAR